MNTMTLKPIGFSIPSALDYAKMFAKLGVESSEMSGAGVCLCKCNCPCSCDGCGCIYSPSLNSVNQALAW